MRTLHKSALLHKILVFSVLIILGLLLRLFFSSLATRELIWDMQSYTNLARDIYQGQWAADCCSKNAGYSLFLAALYHLFGFENLNAARIANIIFDLLTAVVIFKIVASRINRKSAWISFILYAGNPITSSYTGLILSENLTLFLVTVLAFLVSKKDFVKNPRLWFCSGFVLGLLALLRYSLFSFGLALIILFAVLLMQKKAPLFLFLALSGFVLASFYSLFSNYRQFKVISFVPPYNPGVIAFYMSFYQTSRYPELVKDYPALDKTYYQLNLEYYTTYYTWIPALKEKYKQLFWQKFRTDWPVFLQNAGRNTFLIWDKDHFFAYDDPFYPADRWFVRGYNLILLFLFGTAMISIVFKKGRLLLKDPLVILTIFLFFYVTSAVTLVSNESRHSLLFYPLIFIWAGYACFLTARWYYLNHGKRENKNPKTAG